jgi:hypothetical protein
MIWTQNGFVVTSVTPSRFTTPEDKYRGIAYGTPWPLRSLDANTGDTVSLNLVDRLLSLEPTPGSAEEELVELLKSLLLYGLVKRNDGLPSTPDVGDLSYSPSAITDLDIALKYIALCDKQNMPTRKLLCATTSQCPVMEEALSNKLLSQSRFLGYDYISWDMDDSVIQQELFYEPTESSSEAMSWVDEVGLTEAAADADRRFKQYSPLLNEFGLFDTEADLLSYISTRAEIAEQTTVIKDGREYSYLETAVELWPCKTWELQRF